jgi:NDP-sugar pyrophosphorylase family protein
VEYFGDGGKFGMRIEYLVEKEAQNTAGSILPYKGRVKEPFMVVMGDHYTDVDVKSMAEFHQKNKAIATLGLLPHETKVEFGVVEMDGDTVKRFVEKPVLTHTINIGMYVFEPEIFRFIKEKEDFAKDVFPRLLANGKRINGFTVQGEWDDVGRVADYERLKEQVEGK